MKQNECTVFTNDLAEIGADLRGQFEEIETCANLQALDIIRPHARFSSLIDASLWDQLSRQQDHPDLTKCPKREEWWNAALERFSLALHSPQIAFAVVPTASKKLFHCKHNGSIIPIRIDQIIHQRYWGVSFYSVQIKEDARIASAILAEALSGFLSDLAAINKFCTEWLSSSSYLSTVSFTHDRLGNRFEKLIQCILNESELLARQSGLYDDVYTWTDLTIRNWNQYKDLRIQVKFLRLIADSEQRLRLNRYTTKVIGLSPAALAQFLESHSRTDWGQSLWQSCLKMFDRCPVNTGDFADLIFSLFENALRSQPMHPLEPLTLIPPPLRQAVRIYVLKRAAEMTPEDKTTSATDESSSHDCSSTPPS